MRKCNLKNCIALILSITICCSSLSGVAFATDGIPESVEGQSTNQPASMLDVLAGVAAPSELYDAIDPDTVPEIVGYENAVSKGHTTRLYSDEGTDLYKLVFLNFDGSKTMYTYNFPVKYVDSDGTIKDITLEIKESNVENAAYETAANAAITTFSTLASDGITLSGNDTEICLVPIIPITVPSDLMASTNDFNITSGAAEITRIDNKTVEYRYNEKTTIEYSLTYTGFKEDIVVAEYTGQSEFSFILYTNGLELTMMNESYYLVDNDGDIRATLGDIIIFTADEKSNTMGHIVPKTLTANEEYLITIVVDEDFLAAEDTVYPIRIDPTVEINYDNNGAGAIADVTVNTNSGSDGASGTLFVGNRETRGISRILMKFPGLNLSSLGNNVAVVNATVSIRDIMCEATPLDVECRIYSGPVWEESTANWGNTFGATNGVSTFLSMNTISYANGREQETVHRYSFDITQAVQGWITGNYAQNKGIVLKASDSVENGSIYNFKTIASYNRSSYKPSLTITYINDGTNLISNDIYYLNNTRYGKYLYYTPGSAPSGCSGLLSTIGEKVRWSIQKVTGGYVIKAANNSNTYLAVPTDATSSDVVVETISDASIPNRCIWSITLSQIGGCLIENTYNSRYLYAYESNLQTATYAGGINSPILYQSRVWRLASTSYYGNSSSNPRKELGFFTIGNTILNLDENCYPSILTSTTNSLWANVSDFAFTYYSGDTGCISVSSEDNEFTGEAIGIATYKATHKVTGRYAYFKVYIDRFTYELVFEFDFSESEAVLIRGVYDAVKAAAPNDNNEMNAWRSSRILGGIVYASERLHSWGWSDVAGTPFWGDEKTYFMNTLGYSENEYNLIKNAVRRNHNDETNPPDFAHMQISLAARLAYSLNKDGLLSNVVASDEEISYLAGWLGDAVLTEGDNRTSFGNDDYHADLDAENIYHLILSGKTLVEATNEYYDSLTSQNTRASIFLAHINYQYIDASINEWLVDKDLRLMIDAYTKLENDEMVAYYENLLNDAEYHLNVIRSQPDTYNFMCSVRDGLADIADYS